MIRYLTVIAALILLTACASRGNKHCPPPATKLVDRPVKVFVAIDKELTKTVPWERNVTPDKSLEAAKKRGEVAEQYERQLKAIEKVQGKTVP